MTIADMSEDAPTTMGNLSVARYTTRQPGVMVRGAISFDSRTPLVNIRGTLTVQRCVDNILHCLFYQEILDLHFSKIMLVRTRREFLLFVFVLAQHYLGPD